MKQLKYILLITISMAMVGCATPVDTSPSHTKVLNPDQDDNIGGSFIESSDIRTIAQQVTTELLALPEINGGDDIIQISTESIKNSTRHLVDTNLLMRRLRLDLNKYSSGQLRFFAQGNGQRARTRILKEREQTEVKNLIDDIAKQIAFSGVIQNSDDPIKLSVAPIANTNLYNMNADGFAAMLRSKIKQHAGTKVIFSKPGSTTEVDYTLTGEFFAQSIKNEGIVNTVEDVKWAQENQDKWHDTDKEENQVMGTQINLNGSSRSKIKVGPNLTYKAIDRSLWYSPNVTKTFNVMLVDNEDMVVLEDVINLENQIKSGQENANFILTGDISSLSKAGDGKRSDYVLIGLYLIDPVSNEMIWEYGYEVKRVTSQSVLYR